LGVDGFESILQRVKVIEKTGIFELAGFIPIL
jgi:hypothetical protein